MTKKRSKFLTVVFSFLPGAGHMFMGFMKMGLSFMAAFFGVIFLSSWLDFGIMLYILPLIWFYAFFDAVNKRFSSDEAFAALTDRFLLTDSGLFDKGNGFFKKKRLFGGIALMILGIYLICKNMYRLVWDILPNNIVNTLSWVGGYIPQIIIGLIIVAIGIRLIVGKKREGGEDA